jgi:hypothetical protein
MTANVAVLFTQAEQSAGKRSPFTAEQIAELQNDLMRATEALGNSATPADIQAALVHCMANATLRAAFNYAYRQTDWAISQVDRMLDKRNEPIIKLAELHQAQVAAMAQRMDELEQRLALAEVRR